MGFFDALADLVAAATPWGEVEAEAVRGGTSEEKTPAQKHGGGEGEAADPSGPTPDKRAAKDAEEADDKDDSKDDGEDGSKDDGGDEGGDDEEEEEEEEMVDPKEKLEEECAESKQCSPAKHHYDECVERVTSADQGKPVDKKHPNEDCVEEFFHLAHCATQCAAPKLWHALK